MNEAVPVSAKDALQAYQDEAFSALQSIINELRHTWADEKLYTRLLQVGFLDLSGDIPIMEDEVEVRLFSFTNSARWNLPDMYVQEILKRVASQLRDQDLETADTPVAASKVSR